MSNRGTTTDTRGDRPMSDRDRPTYSSGFDMPRIDMFQDQFDRMARGFFRDFEDRFAFPDMMREPMRPTLMDMPRPGNEFSMMPYQRPSRNEMMPYYEPRFPDTRSALSLFDRPMMMQPFGRRSRFDLDTIQPRVDMKDDGKQLIVHADLPGMRKEDVKVDVTDNVLSISGTAQESQKKEGENYVLQERAQKNFYRSFTLPENCNQDQIKADFTNGVLEVAIPKLSIEPRNTKSIPISG